jgi:hypothetical protein
MGTAGDLLRLMPRRKTRARLNIDISDFDRCRLQKLILDGSIFRIDGERGREWHDLRGLVTGHFFECVLRYCQEDNEESQRALWEVFREDILTAQKKYAPGTKPWGCRFDPTERREQYHD